MKNSLNNFTAISDFIDKESIDNLSKECVEISKCTGADKNFWFSFDRQPQNIIEDYIIQTIKSINYTGDASGAEWWVRVFNESYMDHPFHLDLDVTLSREKSIVKTPEISTILYLSWDGGPTVITNCEKYEDSEKYEYYPEVPNVVWISNPKPAKFVYWSKPYIHGVFGGPNFQGPRITLMFNLWKQKPLQPECVEYFLSHTLSTKKISTKNTNIDIIPVLKGKDPVSLKLKGDHNMVKCYLYEGLPLGGTYMIVT